MKLRIFETLNIIFDITFIIFLILLILDMTAKNVLHPFLCIIGMIGSFGLKEVSKECEKDVKNHMKGYE